MYTRRQLPPIPPDWPGIATQALDQIAKTRKGYVYASRKGICMGSMQSGCNHVVMFRRVQGVVRMQIESYLHSRQTPLLTLPIDLEKRAAQMLDNL